MHCRRLSCLTSSPSRAMPTHALRFCTTPRTLLALHAFVWAAQPEPQGGLRSAPIVQSGQVAASRRRRRCGRGGKPHADKDIGLASAPRFSAPSIAHRHLYRPIAAEVTHTEPRRPTLLTIVPRAPLPCSQILRAIYEGRLRPAVRVQAGASGRAERGTEGGRIGRLSD